MKQKIKTNKDFGSFGLIERQILLKIAKESVMAAVDGQQSKPAIPKFDNLIKNGAAFVTLKKNGQLRGCIGHVIAAIPLFECVNEMAHFAAINDSRFSPVSKNELELLNYEISILTEPKLIKPQDVVVGRDGLIISRGTKSGLLLPQVPVEWNWTKEEFLDNTCRKAFLPLDSWQDSQTEIKSFRAIIFGEEDI